MIQLQAFCGICKQTITAVVRPEKGGAVATHLHAALTAVHTQECYKEETDGREGQGSTDPRASSPESEGTGGSAEGEDPQSTVH